MQKLVATKLLWLLGLFFTAWMFVTLKIHFDNLQILDKAVRLIDLGEWTHYGNFGSGVGFLPGSLTTLLSAVPMKIYFSPYSAMAVIALFHIFSCWILLVLAKELFPKEDLSVILLVFFWLNPWRVEQAELYNPGYLFLFATLHFLSAYHMRNNKNGVWTFIHILGIGLCSQIHFSALLLAFATIFLFWKKQIRMHWLGATLAVFAYLASLIPYFLSLLNHPELALTSHHSEHSYFGRNLLLVYPVFKALLYLLRYGSTYYGRHIFSEINFDYLSSESLRHAFRMLLSAIQWPMAIFTLLLSTRTLGGFVWQQLRRQSTFSEHNIDECEHWFGQYLLSIVLGATLASALSPVEFNHWHLILCFPIVSFFMALNFNSWLKNISPGRGKIVLGMILAWFCLQNALAAAGSRSHSFRNNFHELVLEHYSRH